MGTLYYCSKLHVLRINNLAEHLHQNTLSFINDEALSVHGNIRLTSIFISPSGEWRLGGFEVLSSMKEDDAVIYVRISSYHRLLSLMGLKEIRKSYS